MIGKINLQGELGRGTLEDGKTKWTISYDQRELGLVSSPAPTHSSKRNRVKLESKTLTFWAQTQDFASDREMSGLTRWGPCEGLHKAFCSIRHCSGIIITS